MRVLATENGVDLHPFFLQVEGFEVMGDRHQVGFRRQLVGRVAPIAIHERPELAAFEKLLQPILYVAEIAGRRQRVRRRDLLLQFRSTLGVRLECGHHVNPIQRMQVIEVHCVVVDLQGLGHHFAYQVRVRRNADAQCIFD